MRQNSDKPQKRLKNGCDPREIGKATQIKPGEVRNPGGRPRKTLLTDAYKDVLERPASEVLSADLLKKVNAEAGATVAEVIALQIAMSAVAGDVKAASHIGDRTEGKAAQTVTLRQDEFAGRSDEDLTFFADHGYWPGEEVTKPN